MPRKLYLWIGHFAHSIVSPFLRPYFKRNTRVRILILDESDNILLVRSWFSHQMWSLPGGGIGLGESVNAAAAREVQEETGLSIAANQFKTLGEFRNVHMHEPFLIKCLYTTVPKQEIRTPKLRKIEIVDAQWFPLKQLPVDISPTVHMAIKMKR